jgi:hypothetical protein
MFILLSILILFAGQTVPHLPHPTHLSSATFAKHPLYTFIAPNGQAISQAPQATQIVLSTVAYRLDAILIPSDYKISLLDFIAVLGDNITFPYSRAYSGKNLQSLYRQFAL